MNTDQNKQLIRRIFIALNVAALLMAGWAASSTAYAQSQTEEEVRQAIREGAEYTNTNQQQDPNAYSSDGALEFWSSGGLLHEIPPDGRPDTFDAISITPKHIRVIPLVEGEAAVAHYYSEGSMKPKGADPVGHYLTRVTQVFIKENGEWKVRSSHWSPVTGGGGTTQAAVEN